MDQAAITKQVAAWDIGTKVTLKANDSKDVSGEVIAHDERTGLLVLKQPGSTPFNSNVTIFKIDSIQSIVSVAPSKTGKEARLPYIDFQRCQDRENKAIAAAELEAAKIGVGVTAEAQRIFDALAKTMPCQWRGRTIVVLDEVSIVPPYDGSSCSQLTPNAKLFDRVQKVASAFLLDFVFTMLRVFMGNHGHPAYVSSFSSEQHLCNMGCSAIGCRRSGAGIVLVVVSLIKFPNA